MKRILITTILLITAISTSFSQWKKAEEYRYVSIKVGLTNSFLDKQPDSIGYKFLTTPLGEMQLIPDLKYFGYTAGYYASVLYNYDLKSGNLGVVFGGSYNYYGISSKYHTPLSNYWLIEKQSSSSVSIPVYVKFGKDFYDKQFYFYAGGAYSMNLFLSQTEEVGWKTEIVRTKLDKNMLLRSNISGILGFNYMFLNIEANYVLGGFLNKEYEEILYTSTTFNPYEKFPKNVLYFKAGLTIPMNSWTPRQVYTIEAWFKRIFGM
jgi:hypothetical protein